MTDQESKQSRKAPGLVFPEGLDIATLTIRVSKNDFSFRDLANKLRTVPTFEEHPGGKAIRGILMAGPKPTKGHAHFSVTQARKKDEWNIELELLPSSHSAVAGEPPTLSFFFAETSSVFGKNPEYRSLLSANFAFKLSEWQPTFPLPFSPAGLLDKLPGTPEIAGIDFSFPDLTEAPGLSRAFVTTYKNIDKLVVRLLIPCRATWSTDLPAELLERSATSLPLLARKREEADSSAE